MPDLEHHPVCGLGPVRDYEPVLKADPRRRSERGDRRDPGLGAARDAGVPFVENGTEPAEGRIDVRVTQYAQDDQALAVVAPLLVGYPVGVPLHAGAYRVLVLGHGELENLGRTPWSHKSGRHATGNEDGVGGLEEPDCAKREELRIPGTEPEPYEHRPSPTITQTGSIGRK
jgi:hypothetical protein